MTSAGRKGLIPDVCRGMQGCQEGCEGTTTRCEGQCSYKVFPHSETKNGLCVL